jgi:hypothetical protein
MQGEIHRYVGDALVGPLWSELPGVQLDPPAWRRPVLLRPLIEAGVVGQRDLPSAGTQDDPRPLGDVLGDAVAILEHTNTRSHDCQVVHDQSKPLRARSAWVWRSPTPAPVVTCTGYLTTSPTSPCSAAGFSISERGARLVPVVRHLDPGLDLSAASVRINIAWTDAKLPGAARSGNAPGEIRTPDLRFRRATTPQATGEVTPYSARACHSTLAKRPMIHAVGLSVGETDAKCGKIRTHG